MNDFFGVDDLLSQMEEDRIYAQVCNDYSSQWHELVSRLPAESEGSEVQLGSATSR